MIPAAKFHALRCRFIATWVLAAALAGNALQAAVDPAPAATATAEEIIEEVTIVGERAGPGLWKIRNGDNTLYVLGTLSPLPKKMTWRSREVENVLVRAQQFIPADVDVSADIGPMRVVRLYLQYLKLRGNEERQTLQEVLPPTLYARFESLRGKYAPNKRDMLKRRPAVAVGELWREAVSRSGLTSRNDINKAVSKLAKARKVPIVKPQVRIDDPQGALADVAQIPREAEIACMRSTLDRLESDLGTARSRAEAWAVGDIEAWRSAASAEQQDTCWSALTMAPKLAEIRQRLDEAWLNVAVQALNSHAVTLAVVPIDEIYKRNGVLAYMRSRGFTVDEP
jgi:uncharacterized protein YbaP (TraB family)